MHEEENTNTNNDKDKDSSAASRRPIPRQRPPLPPTSWQKRTASGSASASGRTSTSSVGSAFSLTLSIPEDEPKVNNGDVVRLSPSESGTTANHQSEFLHVSVGIWLWMFVDMLVIASPPIPDDVPAQQQKFDNEKVLPPLPPSALRKYPTTLTLRTPATTGAGGSTTVSVDQRTGTISTTSSVSSAGAVTGHNVSVTQSTPAPTTTSPITTPPLPSPQPAIPPPPPSPTTTTTTYAPRRTPRPLRLSQSINPGVQPGELPYRSSGQILTYNRNIHDQQRMRVISGPSHVGTPSSIPSTAPTTPTTPGFSKPMPRTGTGMVYRTSSNPGKPPPMRMRMPGAASQSLSLSSSAGREGPPTPTMPIPIAL
jgi:hypothetical protein